MPIQWLILIVSACSLCNPAQAQLSPKQFTPREISTYSCLKDTLHRKLLYPGDSSGLTVFYQKLDTLLNRGDGRVRVFHLGDSHVQGGMLSHRLRMNLASLGNDSLEDVTAGIYGQRGLFFPFRAIRTNGLYGYQSISQGRWTGSRCISSKQTVPLGLSGAAAITADSAASVYVNAREEGRWNFSEVHVLGEASDSTVYPIVITAKGDTIRQETDNIDKHSGTWVFQLPEADSCCTIRFEGLGKVRKAPVPVKGKGRPAPNYQPLDSVHHFVLRGIIPRGERQGLTYLESGINGASLESWLRCDDSLFCQELSLLNPDLVILGLGTNDSNVLPASFDTVAFKANYRKVIDRIHRVNPESGLLFLTCPDYWINTRNLKRTPNKNSRLVQESVIDLAKEFNAPVFDIYALMGGLGACNKWALAHLMQKDHIHFSKEGYFLIADLLYNAIIEDFKHE